MFFEKITENNLKNLEFWGIKVTKFKQNGDSLYLELGDGMYKFSAKDFYVRAECDMPVKTLDSFQGVWRDFMCDTFGEEYKIALKNRRNNA